MCREENVKKKRKKASFKGQLKALYNQLPTSHYCLVGQEQKAARGNAAQPARIFKILMKVGLHKDIASSSGFAELFSSASSTVGAVTLSKVRGIQQKLASGKVLHHRSCQLAASRGRWCGNARPGILLGDVACQVWLQ